MEIRPDEITIEKQKPISLFHQGIKADATRLDYTNKLKKVLCEFLRLVLKGDPRLVEKQKQDSTKRPGVHRTFYDADFEARATELVKKAKADPDWSESILMKLSEKLRERSQLEKTDAEYLNPITIQNYFKPVQKLYDMNGVSASWKKIKSTFPELEKSDANGEYIHKDIRQMLTHCKVNDKVIILLYASSGIRAGAFDFTWKDVKPIYKHNDQYLYNDEDITESVSKDGQIVGGFIKIYAGSNSEYVSFFTSECWKTIQEYRRLWTKETGREPKPDHPFFKQSGALVQKLGYSGIRKRVERILIQSGIRMPLVKGKRRHDIPAFNGFRRFFNKQNKKSLSKTSLLASLILKENMMGHGGLIKLDQNYFKEHIDELIEEYLQAVPNLTISNEDRLEADLIKQEKKIDELEQKEKRITRLENHLHEIEHYMKSKQGKQKGYDDFVVNSTIAEDVE